MPINTLLTSTQISTRPASTLQNFFEGGLFYNIVNMLLALVGVLLAILALWIALVQIKKTLDAATAAKRATESVTAKLSAIGTFMSINQLCGVASEASTALTTGAFEIASLRIADLRVGIARIKPHFQSDVEVTTSLQDLLLKLNAVEDFLRHANSPPTSTRRRSPQVTRGDALRHLSEIREKLTEHETIETIKMKEA